MILAYTTNQWYMKYLLRPGARYMAGNAAHHRHTMDVMMNRTQLYILRNIFSKEDGCLNGILNIIILFEF